MGKIIAYFMVIIMISLCFMSAYKLYGENLYKRELEQSLNLSCKVFKTCIIKTGNKKEAGKRAPIVENIDKEKLLQDFYDILSLNYPNITGYNNIKRNIRLKMIIHGDRMYYAGTNNKWSIPVFFTEYNEIPGTEVYFNINDDSVYYYIGTDKYYTDLNALGITNEEKYELIIDKVNSIVAKNTIQRTVTGSQEQVFSAKLNIQNPYTSDNTIKHDMSYFNILEGSTFFVIYTEGLNHQSGNMDFTFKNLAVSGYTIR
jgi:hypothetical protein